MFTFGGDPVADTDSASLFHFPRHCENEDFRRFISISYTVTDDFHDLDKMKDADKPINPLHFGSDPADIGIRI